MNPNQLQIGKTYGIAHGPFSPCVHWSIYMYDDASRQHFMEKIGQWQAANGAGYWFPVVDTPENGWVKLPNEPVPSPYGLFSED